MNDDGEPQTVLYRDVQVTTWRDHSDRWWVHAESWGRDQEGAFSKEKRMPRGRERLDAYELAKTWIDRHLGTPV